MAKQLLKKYQKYPENVFDSLITGDETWVHFYVPKQKVDNRIWALKHAKRSSSAKRTLTAKKVLYAISYTNSGPHMQIAVPKGRGVSDSFYKNVVLKRNVNKNEKSTSKHRSLACLFVTWQCSNLPILNCSTVFQVWKGNVLLSPPPPRPTYIPDLAPCDCFPLSEIEKKIPICQKI